MIEQKHNEKLISNAITMAGGLLVIRRIHISLTKHQLLKDVLQVYLIMEKSYIVKL